MTIFYRHISRLSKNQIKYFQKRSFHAVTEDKARIENLLPTFIKTKKPTNMYA